MTLSRWLDQWLAELVAANRSVNTVKNYRGHSGMLGNLCLGTCCYVTYDGPYRGRARHLAAPVEGESPAAISADM